jgi:hypothetical protein
MALPSMHTMLQALYVMTASDKGQALLPSKHAATHAQQQMADHAPSTTTGILRTPCGQSPQNYPCKHCG